MAGAEIGALTGGDRGARRPLRGRDTELAWFGSMLTGLAQHGTPPLVVVEGVAGIGKSRLLGELGDLAAAHGIAWSVAACDPIAHDRPFGPLLEALRCERSSTDPRRVAIAEAASQLTGTDLGSRYGVQDEIVDLLLDEAEEHPAMLVVDDAQWIDAATVSAIGALVRRRRGRPMGVLLAMRPGSSPAELDALLDRWADELRVLVLDPLAPAAVDLVAGDVLGVEPPPGLRDALARAGGNSFSVVQLARAFASEGVATPRRTGVRSSVVARARALGNDGLTVLSTAAVLGVEFTPDDLCLLTGRDPFEVFDLLYGAARTGLLVARGDRFAFSHDLVADLLVEELPAPLRRTVHRTVVRLAGELRLTPTVVAHHVMASAVTGDVAAIDALCRAAADVGSHDPHLALTFLDAAAALCDERCDRVVQIALQRADALCLVRRATDAIDALTAALGRADSPDAVMQLRVARARCMHLLGDVSGAADEFERLARSGAMDTAGEAAAWADVATYRMWAMQGMRPWTEADRAIELARTAGVTAPAVQALAAQSALAAFEGQLDRAVELGEEACRQGLALPHHTIIPAPAFSLGVARLIADDLDGAISLLHRERLRIEGLGDPFLAIRPATALLIALYLAGRWDDVIAEADAILGACDDTGGTVGRLTALVLAGLVAHHRGDHDAAVARLDAANGISGVADGYAVPFLLQLRALELERDGRLADAASLMADTCTLVTALAPSIRPWFTLDAVRLAQRGATTDPASLVDGLVEHAATFGRPGPHGMALVASGAARLDAAMVRAGVALVAASPQPLNRALTFELAAGVLTAAGDPQGAEVLGAARLDYEDLGAGDLAVRAAGPAGRTRPIRVDRPRFGWGSLTPAELAVVRLLAGGARNGEIASTLVLSKRTVESHVSSMMVKLGVTGRVELANLAHRHLGS